MQKDYKRLIKTDSSGATNETGIWSDVIFKEKGWTGTNMCDKSETDLIKSIGLIKITPYINIGLSYLNFLFY